jgi:hypothetical protein
MTGEKRRRFSGLRDLLVFIAAVVAIAGMVLAIGTWVNEPTEVAHTAHMSN